jgi:hypothetical protein
MRRYRLSTGSVITMLPHTFMPRSFQGHRWSPIFIRLEEDWEVSDLFDHVGEPLSPCMLHQMLTRWKVKPIENGEIFREALCDSCLDEAIGVVRAGVARAYLRREA